METGYGRHTIVVEVEVDNESLLSQLMKLRDHANELSAMATRIIHEIQQVKTETGSDKLLLDPKAVAQAICGTDQEAQEKS